MTVITQTVKVLSDAWCRPQYTGPRVLTWMKPPGFGVSILVGVSEPGPGTGGDRATR